MSKYEDKITEIKLEERLENMAKELKDLADYEATTIHIHCTFDEYSGECFAPSILLFKKNPEGKLELYEVKLDTPGAMLGAFDTIRDIIK